MTDAAGRDDQSCSWWYWLHCNQAVGAIKRLNLQILLFIIHTFCMLPQVAFQALNTQLMVSLVRFTTYALKAIIRGIKRTHDISMWHIATNRVWRPTLALCCMFLIHFKDICAFRYGNISNSRVTGSWTVILWIEIYVRLTFSPFCRGNKIFPQFTTIFLGLIVIIRIIIIIRRVWGEVFRICVFASWFSGFFLNFPWTT